MLICVFSNFKGDEPNMVNFQACFERIPLSPSSAAPPGRCCALGRGYFSNMFENCPYLIHWASFPQFCHLVGRKLPRLGSCTCTVRFMRMWGCGCLRHKHAVSEDDVVQETSKFGLMPESGQVALDCCTRTSYIHDILSTMSSYQSTRAQLCSH